MKTNKAGIELIKSFEALRTEAYKPTPDDVWTIGYGHTKGVKEGDIITNEIAERMLKEDLDAFEAGVTHALGKIPARSNEFSAMVSLAFNIGLGNFKTSSVLRNHKEGKHTEAASCFKLWNKQRGSDGVLRELKGLVRRRKAEAELYART